MNLKVIEGGRKQLEYETLDAIFSNDKTLLEKKSKRLDELNSHRGSLFEAHPTLHEARISSSNTLPTV